MSLQWVAFTGIVRHELTKEIKSGIFFISLFFPIVLTFIFGFAISFQSIPPEGVPVGLYVDPSLPPSSLESSKTIVISTFMSQEDLDQALLDEYVIVGVYLHNKSGSPDVTIVVDDTKSVVAKAALADIYQQLAGQGMNHNNSLLEVREQYGLGLDTNDYFMKLMAPGLIMMIVLYSTMLIYGFGLAQEREDHTIFELAMAPVPSSIILLGKLCAAMLTMGFQILLGFLTVAVVVGRDPEGSVVEMFVVYLLLGLGLVGLMFLATSFVKDIQKLRLVLGLPILFPMIFFSGIFYPLEALPNNIEGLTMLIPTTWAMNIAKGVYFKGLSILDFPWEITLLIAWVLVLVGLGSIRFRKIVQSG